MARKTMDETTFFALLKGLKDVADEWYLDVLGRVRCTMGTQTYDPVTYLHAILGHESYNLSNEDFEGAAERLGLDWILTGALFEAIEKIPHYNMRLRKYLLESLELSTGQEDDLPNPFEINEL